ncbi:MAG TPA: hypothetical protein VLA12_09455 [Planctomycetaceae bacterium]|nr:hypothetical protein [Planctomycetaceae bacterium]
MELIIAPCGNIRCIYDETLDLSQFGQVRIERASHVEPTLHGQWRADLSPVNGPELGPFSLRSEALRAELEWLERHWLTTG